MLRHRLYRIYVSDKMLAGTYIAGQLYDAQSAAHQLQLLSLFLSPLLRRGFAQREARERLYDRVDPFAPTLLEHDSRNFHVPRSDVMWTRFRTNRSLWTGLNVSSVEFECLDGTRQRFILVGDQQHENIMQLLQKFDPAIDVTWKANLLPKPNPISPARTRSSMAFMGSLLLFFGAISAQAAIAGPGLNLALFAFAVLHLGLGSRLLVRSRCWSNSGSPEEESDETNTDG
jgi:hypothetical protein